MRPRFEDVYAGYLREGAEVAFLLTGDETVAVDIAHQALVRSLVSYRELRRPNDFDLWWYRDLFRIARRRERRRILRAKRLGPTGLRRAPFRVRGAVILDRLLGLTDDDAATILGCSPAAARAALQRGVALLGADGETDRLRAAVAGAALGSPSALPRSLHGRVRALRWLSAVAVTIILVASVGAVIWNPPRGVSTARPELPTQPFEPLEDTGLRVDRCADVSGAKVPGAKTIAKAERTAVRFGRALVRGKIGVVTALRDPAAEGLAFDEWARPGSGRGLRASGSRAATDDGVVAFACGRGIAARTWKVFVRDNSPISIKGLAIYYLVRRGDGWLVWASHKPGPLATPAHGFSSPFWVAWRPQFESKWGRYATHFGLGIWVGLAGGEDHGDRDDVLGRAVLGRLFEDLDRPRLLRGDLEVDVDRVVAPATGAAGGRGEGPHQFVAARIEDPDRDRGLEHVGGTGDEDRALVATSGSWLAHRDECIGILGGGRLGWACFGGGRGRRSRSTRGGRVIPATSGGH